jgi:hypothetical protein
MTLTAAIRSRTLLRTIAFAGPLVVGVIAASCSESRFPLGADCLKDEDCLSGICSQQKCAATPPYLDAEAVATDSGASGDASGLDAAAADSTAEGAAEAGSEAAAASTDGASDAQTTSADGGPDSAPETSTTDAPADVRAGG